MASISSNVLQLLSKIGDASKRSKYNYNIDLLAACKKQSEGRVKEFVETMNANGLKAKIGDNYVQEALAREGKLFGDYEHHLIGKLQSNKVKNAVRIFDVIQSVDSLKLAMLIAEESRKLNKQTKLCIQVNISKDENKSGFLHSELKEVLEFINGSTNVILHGLMAITAFYEDADLVRNDYKNLKKIFDQIASQDIVNADFRTLSMGMSGDFTIAVEEGSTMVRLGEAIFGKRD